MAVPWWVIWGSFPSTGVEASSTTCSPRSRCSWPSAGRTGLSGTLTPQTHRWSRHLCARATAASRSEWSRVKDLATGDPGASRLGSLRFLNKRSLIAVWNDAVDHSTAIIHAHPRASRPIEDVQHDSQGRLDGLIG